MLIVTVPVARYILFVIKLPEASSVGVPEYLMRLPPLVEKLALPVRRITSLPVAKTSGEPEVTVTLRNTFAEFESAFDMSEFIRASIADALALNVPSKALRAAVISLLISVRNGPFKYESVMSGSELVAGDAVARTVAPDMRTIAARTAKPV